MKYFLKILFVFFLISSYANADELSQWLNKEIDNIIDIYKNESIDDEEKFRSIEETINKNFAGSGIARFVVGKAWASASKETKKEYISIFKRHLALNIATMMQNYSNQKYSLSDSRFDEQNDVSLVDMEIKNNSSNIVVTWRVKKSKDRFFIIDLMVADISLVVTKRSEFNSMLKKVDYNLDSFNEILRNQNQQSYQMILN